jgi:adenosylhomocysteine nucleosidase
LCGVGKIHASFATTYLFENYDITKLINIGVVGNLRGDMMQVGDVILPNTFLQHDTYIPEFINTMEYLREPIFLEYAIGEDYDLQKFELRLHGICLTGDQFIDKSEKMEELEETYGADIVDMEAYAILSVAKAYDKLDVCVVIKSISDGADNEAVKDFSGNLDFAMQNAIAILDFVL